MVVTNAKWWDSLPADVKKGLSEAMTEATADGNKIANDINETDKKRIADAGKAKIQTLARHRRPGARPWSRSGRNSRRTSAAT